ncbi:ABC transporter substrate-binding protein [Rhodococcus pseudokoreensis]|uniref:ABC transporter substrate-binding protein n=1 Tax=Rhodococcus pseudokoreensis TaxID=2811421 RepID=A0A974ZTZ5_9NOCA|nr:ABC transporter substrate-binding protein [Rhodococcus pseudokoreensis]QSE90385.1 ABC transporter substrate-binding protein [Rhodococcus pseudokoreensis]
MQLKELSRLRQAVVLGATAILAVGVVGCSSSDDSAGSDSGATSSAAVSSEKRTFEAQNGAIEIPAEPQSIVACGYAVLPLIQAKANLSAVCEWTREVDNMDAETKAAYDALPKVAQDADISTLNYEGVSAANPDLIIMGVPARAQSMVDMDKLQSLAPVVFLGPKAPGEWRTLGEQFADAAAVSDNYGEFKQQYDDKAAQIAAKYKDSLGTLTFGGVCDTCAGDPGEFYREFASSYTTNLFDDLGLQFPGQPADPANVHGEFVSTEQIAAGLGTVDVIVYGVGPDGKVSPELQALMDSPLWKSLPAVQAGNVVPVQHALAATYQTALLALDSIDEGLSKLPANKQ